MGPRDLSSERVQNGKRRQTYDLEERRDSPPRTRKRLDHERQPSEDQRHDDRPYTRRRSPQDEPQHRRRREHGGARRADHTSRRDRSRSIAEVDRHSTERDRKRHRDENGQIARQQRDYSSSRQERGHGRRDRSTSPVPHRRRSPPSKKRRRSYSVSQSPPPRRSRGPLPTQQESFGGAIGGTGALDKPVEKQKPNFSASGLLAKEANTVAGTTTVLKYHEPPEARKPPADEQWRMYIFKGKDMLDTVYLYQRSCWLMGRDQAVADLQLEHPSISKQHAVIQFRYMPKKNEYGDRMDSVKPYLIDLDSANATRLNGKKVQGSRFVELIDGDVLGFGESEREYVMMKPPAEG